MAGRAWCSLWPKQTDRPCPVGPGPCSLTSPARSAPLGRSHNTRGCAPDRTPPQAQAPPCGPQRGESARPRAGSGHTRQSPSVQPRHDFHESSPRLLQMKEVRSFLTTTFYTQASNTTTKLSEFQVNLAHFKLVFSLFSILAEIVVSVSLHLCQK